MMSKKVCSVLACLLVISLLCSACGGSGSPPETPSAESPAEAQGDPEGAPQSAAGEDPVVITAWLNAPQPNEMAYLERFSEKYPQYTFQYDVFQDDDLKEQSRIAVQAGTAPTILRPKVGSQLDEFIAANALVGLNPYSQQYGWKEMSYDDIYEACSQDGELYAVPRSTGGHWQTLYYNVDMADEIGLDLSADLTIDDFAAIKADVEAAGMQMLAIGNVERWPGLILFGDYLLQSAHPDLVDRLNAREVKWNESPEILRTLGALQKLGTSGVLLTGFESQDHIVANQTWAAGKAMFMYCGTWWPETLANGFDDVNFEIGTITLPLIDGDTQLQGQMFFANDAYAIYSGASPEEIEGAAAWLDYSFNLEGSAAKFADNGVYGVNKAFNESGIDINPLFETYAITRQMDLPQMNYADWAFSTPVIEGLKLQIVDLFAGTKTPEQVADAIEQIAAEED